MRHDRRGIAVTSSSVAAVDRFDEAVAGFLAHRADTAERLAAALAADDRLVLGHCLSGFLNLFLGRSELLPPARRALERALASLAERGGTARERALAASLDAWCGGEMELSAAILDASLGRQPLDAMTVKLLHNLRFMLGDVSGMRRSLDSVLPAWNAATPEFGFILGCHAFALEESGALDAAEAAGKQALALAPQDVWGCHAVAHVHERRGEPARGIAWLRAHDRKWDDVNNFARHMAWHEALYRLARNESDTVFALYDRAIRAVRSDDYRDLANAAGLLHRLERAGHKVGRRWDELADIAERRSRDHALVFAQLHYLLCLIGAGRRDSAYRSFAAMDLEARAGNGSQARLLAKLGVPLAKILLADGADRHPAMALTVPALRARLTGLGGSQAQREIFERILDAAEARRHPPRAVA
jgi:tetratricopeptide (TPR) repeat protein